MRSVNQLTQKAGSIVVQILIVIAAFALMGILSFIFVRRIERMHLIKDAEDALLNADSEITANLMEPETFLGGFSETVRHMILRGDSADMVTAYIKHITGYLINTRDSVSGFSGAFGFFDVFGDLFVPGQNWIPPDTYIPQERPWYKAAIAAGGDTTTSEPYVDALSGDVVLTVSRRIFDDEDRPLGVISLVIKIDRILNYAVDIKLSQNSYGILIDTNMIVIAHPDEYLVNIPLRDHHSELSSLADELEMGLDISEREVKNYRGEKCIVFFRQIKYGWHIGVVTPVNEYYKSVYNMAVFLVSLGAVLAAALSVILYRIFAAKRASDIKTQQKSNFLATMSHEIRTPLNAILGIAEINLQNDTLPQNMREAFIKINNSGDILLNIINDILDLSKIEAGKLELTLAKYEVPSLINDVVQLNMIRYASNPVEFKLLVDENIPLELVGDELRIKQILNNLLSNAFKYTQRGEVTFEVNAECVARGGAVHVKLVFRVSDTGQGMTKEQVQKLFDEYTRFNLEANRSTEGTGLGMSITQKLVDLMYGKISVKSEVGAGTSVTVHLPQKTDGAGISGVIGKELAENLQRFRLGNILQGRKTQITHDPMPYGSVLIVDDVESNIYVAKGLLAPYGLRIDVALSGFETIEKIKEGNVYDIIFMDHMMPKMDGIEATKIIRDMGYKRPVVALTANALAGREEMFLNSGFDGFISKPIDIRQLNLSLNKLVRDKQPPEVIEKARREKAEQERKQAANKTQQQPVASQLAEIFARDAEKAVTVLESLQQNSYRRDGDVQMFIINVHAMKSALANVGETELSAVAFMLEQAGRDGDVEAIMAETPGFLNALHSVIDKNKPRDNTGESIDEDPDDQRAYLHEKLLVIREACAEYDKKTAKNTLTELREKNWSNQTKELLNAIAEHILHSEFDEAAELAGNYSKNADRE